VGVQLVILSTGLDQFRRHYFLMRPLFDSGSIGMTDCQLVMQTHDTTSSLHFRPEVEQVQMMIVASALDKGKTQKITLTAKRHCMLHAAQHASSLHYSVIFR
jgi:hypothetical protein